MNILGEWQTIQDGLLIIPLDEEANIDGTDIVTMSFIPADDGELIGKDLTVIGSTSDDGVYIIIDNVGTDITIDTILTSTEVISVTIEDDQDIFDEIELLKTYLNSSTPSSLVNFKLPTYNSFFSNTIDLVETVVNYQKYYIDETIPYDAITDVNTVIAIPIDLDTISPSEYVTQITSTIDELNTIFSEVEAYIVRLKTFSADVKISTNKTEDGDWNSYYILRTSSSKTLIDSLYDEFVSGGQTSFMAKYRIEAELIKIVR